MEVLSELNEIDWDKTVDVQLTYMEVLFLRMVLGGMSKDEAREHIQGNLTPIFKISEYQNAMEKFIENDEFYQLFKDFDSLEESLR